MTTRSKQDVTLLLRANHTLLQGLSISAAASSMQHCQIGVIPTATHTQRVNVEQHTIISTHAPNVGAPSAHVLVVSLLVTLGKGLAEVGVGAEVKG